MSDLDRYLTDHLEQYVFNDIDTLLKRADVAAGEKYGARGHPLLLAVFSGIERLGRRSSPSAFSSARGKPNRVLYRDEGQPAEKWWLE